jgi:excisionase family DNA binding protein
LLSLAGAVPETEAANQHFRRVARSAEVTASLLTYAETADALHVSERTAYRLAASGHLEKVQIAPNTVRIRAESVTRHIERGYSTPSDLQEAS